MNYLDYESYLENYDDPHKVIDNICELCRKWHPDLMKYRGWNLCPACCAQVIGNEVEGKDE